MIILLCVATIESTVFLQNIFFIPFVGREKVKLFLNREKAMLGNMAFRKDGIMNFFLGFVVSRLQILI